MNKKITKTCNKNFVNYNYQETIWNGFYVFPISIENNHSTDINYKYKNNVIKYIRFKYESLH